MMFITDIDRKKLLAIGHDPSANAGGQGQQAGGYNQNKNKKLMEEEIANNNMPKF